MAEMHVQHIGSLIRPKALVDAVQPLRATVDRNKEGTVQQELHVKNTTENCIKDIVNEQIKRGIVPITSGEFERVFYVNGLFEGLDGFERKYLAFDSGAWRPRNPFNEFAISANMEGRDAMIAVSKIKRRDSPYLKEWRFLRSCLPETYWHHAKITVLTPTWWHQTLQKPYTDDSGYESDEAYLADIVAALREEILHMYDEGLRNVQVDDPILSWVFSDKIAAELKEQGTNVDRLMDLCMMAHSNLTQDLPQDLNIAHHMCRGNVPGDPESIVVTGGYESLAARLFNETKYKQFCLEHVSSQKHGDFTFLNNLKEDQVVVLGIVTTKFEELEDVKQLRERVMNAAEVIAAAQGRDALNVLRRNVAISPQCGFASSMDLAAMTIDRQWEKLALLQQLAAELWPSQTSYST